MNKEEIKRNLENYILQTNGKTYLTFETNTNLMARDCLNTIEQLISQLDIANKKIEKLDNEIKSVINIIKQQPSNDDEWILGRLNGFLSIIGGE